MNYVTTCPSCETQFFLNTEQLKAHRGKVQCGNCQHVFNAKNRLIKVAEETTNTDANPNNSGNQSEYLNVDASISNLDSASDVVDLSQTLKHNTNQQAVDENEAIVISHSNTHDDSHKQFEDHRSSIDQTELSDNSAPTFVQDLTTEPQFSKEPFKLKSLFLPFFGLLLLILAILQIVYFLRVQLAAQYPQFKPHLQHACQVLLCEIKLAQNLSLLTIDDSDMQESDDYQNVISFSSVLINNANYIQAYPNIELTLTDMQDQPVLRKLVTPKEYLNEGIEAEAGIGALQEMRLNLVMDAGNLSVAGYRILLAY